MLAKKYVCSGTLFLSFIVFSKMAAAFDNPVRRMADFVEKQPYRHRLACTLHFVAASESLAQICKLNWKGSPAVIKRREKRLSNLPARVLIGINAAIYVAWQGAIRIHGDTGIAWMLRHFAVRPTSIMSRPYTLLTAAFSHMTLDHIVSNMSALWLFVPDLVALFGYRKFFYFYVASAYASKVLDHAVFDRIFHVEQLTSILKYILHCYGYEIKDVRCLTGLQPFEKEKNYRLWKSSKREIPSLGASGALSAVQMYYCLSFPHQRFHIFGIKDVPAPLTAILWALDDLMKLHRLDNIGHGTHLGGYLFGLLVWGIQAMNAYGWRQIWKKTLSFLGNVFEAISSTYY